MKKIQLIVACLCFIIVSACNNAETGSTEPMVRDSMGVSAAPVTGHVDSAAADTLNQPLNTGTVAPAATESAATGVQSITENFVSADGQAVQAVYANNEQIHLVTLTINGEEIKLMQTEAWAKGAEYSNGKITWRAEGSDATLTKDGKETKFGLKK